MFFELIEYTIHICVYSLFEKNWDIVNQNINQDTPKFY